MRRRWWWLIVGVAAATAGGATYDVAISHHPARTAIAIPLAGALFGAMCYLEWLRYRRHTVHVTVLDFRGRKVAVLPLEQGGKAVRLPMRWTDRTVCHTEHVLVFQLRWDADQ